MAHIEPAGLAPRPPGRSSRVLVLVAAALVVGLAFVLLVLALRSDGNSLGGRPTLGPLAPSLAPVAPVPSSSPSPAPSISAPASESAPPVPAGSRSAPPSAAPSASATELSSSARPVAWEISQAYLTPAAAARAEMPGWSVVSSHRPSPTPLLDPCAQERFPGASAIRAGGERLMRSERDSGGSSLVQEVFRYDSAGAASAAFDEYLGAVRRCPEAAAVEGSGTIRFSVLDQAAAPGGRTALVQLRPCSEAGCIDTYRSYVFLVQSSTALTTAFYGRGEDGAPRAEAARLRSAAAEQLRRAAR